HAVRRYFRRGDIACDDAGHVITLFPQLLRERVEALFIDIRQHETVALSKPPREGATHAAAGAGDDGEGMLLHHASPRNQALASAACSTRAASSTSALCVRAANQ